MKIKRGNILFLCIIWLLIILVIRVYAATINLDLTCKDINALQNITTKPSSCTNVSTKGENPNNNITIVSRNTGTGYLNSPYHVIVNYTGGTIPAGATIGNICVNITIASISGDNSIADWLNISYWKASSSDWFRIMNEFTAPATAPTTYAWCNNTIITTVADANALKVRFSSKGDATASNDSIAYDYINVNISYTEANNPPLVTNISISTTQSIVENGVNNVTFSFVASDPQGIGDLNDASARARFNITVGAVTTIIDGPCSWVADTGTWANYSCGLNLWYWNANGTWTVNVSITDITGPAVTENRTSDFALGATGSIQIAPNAINFNTLTINTFNNTATDDPIIINNTGNINVSVGNVKITTIDLAGTSDGTTIAAENFTVGIATGSFSECDVSATANKTINNTAISITKTGLARGNLTNVSPVNTTFQEQLYLCFYKPVPTWLPPQTYDTTEGGPWTITIV